MSTPLRNLVDDLLHDPSARLTFAADPARYLDEHGWPDLDGADVGTAFDALRQELPIDDAVRLGSVDTDSFGDGAAGAITGLQAAAAAFDVDWSDDPATTIDDPGVLDTEPDAVDAAEETSQTFEPALSDDSNVPEPEVEVEVEYQWDDPLLAVGEPDVPPDLDLDLDLDLDVPHFDEGFDDG